MDPLTRRNQESDSGRQSDPWEGCVSGGGALPSTVPRDKLVLWPAIPPYRPPNPRNSKTRKSDSKVTFGLPARVTQKWLKSGENGRKSHFWVTLAGSLKATFESLFHVFQFSGVWGSVGGMAGHNTSVSQSDQSSHESHSLVMLEWVTVHSGARASV